MCVRVCHVCVHVYLFCVCLCIAYVCVRACACACTYVLFIHMTCVCVFGIMYKLYIIIYVAACCMYVRITIVIAVSGVYCTYNCYHP